MTHGCPLVKVFTHTAEPDSEHPECMEVFGIYFPHNFLIMQSSIRRSHSALGDLERGGRLIGNGECDRETGNGQSRWKARREEELVE